MTFSKSMDRSNMLSLAQAPGCFGARNIKITREFRLNCPSAREIAETIILRALDVLISVEIDRKGPVSLKL